MKTLPDHAGQDMRHVLPEMEAEEQGDSLDEEEVAIAMELQKWWRRVGQIGHQHLEMCKEEIIRGDS